MISPDNKNLQALLILHEGLKLETYLCPSGKLTIGVGHNLEARPIPGLSRGSKITRERAMEILTDDLRDVSDGINTHIKWAYALDEARQAALVDMAFNLGIAGLLGFKKFLSELHDGLYLNASLEMLDSKWARQVRHRATRLSKMIETGEWPKEISV